MQNTHESAWLLDKVALSGVGPPGHQPEPNRWATCAMSSWGISRSLISRCRTPPITLYLYCRGIHVCRAERDFATEVDETELVQASAFL